MDGSGRSPASIRAGLVEDGCTHGHQLSADPAARGRPCREGYWQGTLARHVAGYCRCRGPSRRHRRVPDHPPGEDHARAGRPAHLRQAAACPGLRREEVASLAGVSVEYYKRLERGNVSGVSELVLEGLARALQLDDAERAHLFDLARAASPVAAEGGRGPSSRRSAPSCSASSTRSPRRRPCATRASTTSAPTRSAGRSTRRCSTAASSRPTAPRFTFLDPAAADFYPDWDRVATELVAHLRSEAGRNPFDRQLSDLIGELSTRSDEFRVRWAAHNVRFHRTGTKRIHHPVVGELELATRRWSSAPTTA